MLVGQGVSVAPPGRGVIAAPGVALICGCAGWPAVGRVACSPGTACVAGSVTAGAVARGVGLGRRRSPISHEPTSSAVATSAASSKINSQRSTLRTGLARRAGCGARGSRGSGRVAYSSTAPRGSLRWGAKFSGTWMAMTVMLSLALRLHARSTSVCAARSMGSARRVE